jgi:hypothetical protein
MSGGCLLWSDPINTPPTVSISCPQDGLGAPGDSACPAEHIPELFRGDNSFQAVAFDKNQSADSLAFEWWYADTSCNNIFDGPSLGKRSTFLHLANQLGNGCVRVVVTDSQGATAEDSLLFKVVDQAPIARLKLSSLAGAQTLAGQPLTLPLFAKVTLTGKDSEDPDDDQFDYRWSVKQDDAVIPMPGCPDPAKDRYLCTFASATPGAFRVQLVVADNWKESAPVEQVIVVATDQLPGIVVETVTPAPPAPPEEAPLPWLANATITFAVAQVDDDGDPYPSTTSMSRFPTPPAGFVWSYKARGAAGFSRVTGQTGPTFTIIGGTFQPQQSIDVRVEYHDRVTACQPYVTGCNAVFDSCARLANICYGPSLRAQWVTWAVDFR